jgi:hypothetical protein
LNKEVAAACVFALLFATGALEQRNKFADLVGVAGVEHSSSDSKSLLADQQYGLRADSGQELGAPPIFFLRQRHRTEGAAGEDARAEPVATS